CHEYTEEDPNCLTGEQLDALLAHIPVQWYPYVATAGFTGLRWGEMSALQWQDLDKQRGEIHVRRSNWKGEVQERLKTKKSRRTVPLCPELAGILTRHRVAMLVGQHPGLEAGWIFPTAEGTLLKGTPLRAVLDEACEAAKIPRITTHGLRRTFNDLAR